MTSHVEYVADQDVEQLNHLIEVAQKRRDDLTLGKRIWVWVVAAQVNEGWFADEDYAQAVAFLHQLGEKAAASGVRTELSIDRRQYRPMEAQQLIAETKSQMMNHATQATMITGPDVTTLSLKPMATAPQPTGEEYFKLLVLDEWNEGGQQVKGWNLVYWLDACGQMPSGWYGINCGDLRHPLGWVLCTDSLPIPSDFTPRPEAE